ITIPLRGVGCSIVIGFRVYDGKEKSNKERFIYFLSIVIITLRVSFKFRRGGVDIRRVQNYIH
ncbi:MAG: hypothetical protein ACK4SO_06605, partial [Candidatus Kapaibacteriota bacterium]